MQIDNRTISRAKNNDIAVLSIGSDAPQHRGNQIHPGAHQQPHPIRRQPVWGLLSVIVDGDDDSNREKFGEFYTFSSSVHPFSSIIPHVIQFVFHNPILRRNQIDASPVPSH